MTHAHCNNGGCTRPVYRGKECFRCWAGTKWTSIILRLRNANGRCRSYVGLPLGFDKDGFIQWVLDNPPPVDMQKPSIDRIKGELGYVPGNIRWLELRKNAAGSNRDLPDGQRKCSRCGEIKAADNEHFPRTRKDGKPALSSMCKPCNRVYQRAWEEKRAASI